MTATVDRQEQDSQQIEGRKESPRKIGIPKEIYPKTYSKEVGNSKTLSFFPTTNQSNNSHTLFFWANKASSDATHF